MGLLGTIFGEAAAKPIMAAGEIADKLFTSDDERLGHAEVMKRLEDVLPQGQIELNKLDAQSGNFFNSGWRPFIGWVGGLGLAWHFIGYDLMLWAAMVFSIPNPPVLAGTESLVNLVIALLGLGVLRTIEKRNGTAG
jgi:hypothetical protein